MKIKITFLLLAVAFLAASPVSVTLAFAQSAPGKTYTPKAGSKERKAIMEALRKPVTKRVRKPVIFRVGSLKVRDGWAFLQGQAQHTNGSALGDEHLWGEVSALLRKKGSTWTVLHWGFATDTGTMDRARQKYPSAPKTIFP